VSRAKRLQKVTRAGAGRDTRPNRVGEPGRNTFSKSGGAGRGWLLCGRMPALKACYTQGKSYEAVIENIKNVISLCLAE